MKLFWVRLKGLLVNGEVWAILSGLAGWVLLSVFLWMHLGNTVWYASAGLLLLSVFGVRSAIKTAWVGAWSLHDKGRGGSV